MQTQFNVVKYLLLDLFLNCDYLCSLLLQTAIYRCKPSGGKALDVKDLKKCLKEIGQESALSWEQPVNLPNGKYPPLMKPVRFPSVGDNWEMDSEDVLAATSGVPHHEL